MINDKKAGYMQAAVMIFSVIALILMFLVFYLLADAADNRSDFSAVYEATSMDTELTLRNILDTPSSQGTIMDLIAYHVVEKSLLETILNLIEDDPYETELTKILNSIFPLMEHELKVGDKTCIRKSIFKIYSSLSSFERYTDDSVWSGTCTALGKQPEVKKELTLTNGKKVTVSLEFRYVEK